MQQPSSHLSSHMAHNELGVKSEPGRVGIHHVGVSNGLVTAESTMISEVVVIGSRQSPNASGVPQPVSLSAWLQQESCLPSPSQTSGKALDL